MTSIGSAARYLIRFDDICPTMNWMVWEEIEAELAANDVRPLLAVVPANEDRTLMVAPPADDFWTRVRGWQARGWAIGLHGYQHRYLTHDGGLVPLNDRSEFAGLTADEQTDKLQRAVEIFRREGIHPDAWIAPGHSFDGATLAALRGLGVEVVSDGFFLSAHRDPAGMLWIPQQLWGFHYRPLGLWTVCFHHNGWTPADLGRFRRDLAAYRDRIVSLSEVLALEGERPRRPWDEMLSRTWLALHLGKARLGAWARTRRRAAV
jgi:peptidoglycan/xylan/chitin deacetylase (PgdA/CDA1 family)